MMLQDIAPSRLYNQYDPSVKAEAEDYLIYFDANQILINEYSDIPFPKVGELTRINKEELIYLFSLDNERFFLGNLSFRDEEGKKKEFDRLSQKDFILQDLKKIREAGLAEKKYIFAAYTAKHLCTWYTDNRFCGRCGHELIHSKTERAMCCNNCHNTIYPKIMPAVIVGVINKDRLLLTKYRRGYNHNALIAGFTEIGETFEETVEREVMEEAGIHVKNIRYYKSQPWGIASDILAGYFCEVDGDDTIHMDSSELKYAEWVKREDIILQPDESSLTNEMMKLFKESKEDI